MQTQKDDRSLGELFADLARDMGVLVRQEVGLATTELTHKATRAGRELATVAVGGLVAYAGLLAILAAIVIGLAAAGLPWWLAALKRADLAPRQTMQTLKEDAQWAKDQMS